MIIDEDFDKYVTGFIIIVVLVFGGLCFIMGKDTYKVKNSKYKELKQLQLNCLDAYVDLNKNKEIYEGLRDIWIGQEKREVKKALESIDKLVVKCIELENKKVDYILSK